MSDPLHDFLGNILKAAPKPVTPVTPAVSPLHSFISRTVDSSHPDIAAIKAKSPFLSAITDTVGAGIHSVAEAADKGIEKNVTNVKDFLKGNLKPTGSDYATGAYDTALGIGKFAKVINEGLLRIGKSMATQVLPGYKEAVAQPDTTGLTEAVAGVPRVSTYQEINDKVNQWSLAHGATPGQAKTLGGLVILGSLFMDNPVAGGVEGAGARALSEEGIAALAKTRTEKAAADILIKEGVTSEAAKATAPLFVKTQTENDVRNAVRHLEKAAQVGREVADGGAVERGFITSVKESRPAIADRVAGYYVPRETDTLSIQAKNLIKDDITTAERMAAEGTDDKAVAVGAQLIKHYEEQAGAAVDTATKNALYDKSAAVANDLARKLTEQGRAVQAASILGRMTPEGNVRFAAREIQKYNESVAPAKRIPELTGEQSQQIIAKAKIVQAMPDGIEKAKAFRELQNDIADLVPTPLYKKLITVWKAGLLTGIKTSGLNTFSNLFHGISEVAKDLPATAVDSLASLFTGKRTIALTGRGTVSGAGEGFQKGWNYLRTGFDERDAARKMDLQRVHFGDSPFAKGIQAYEESVFRVLGAEDQPFYYGAKAHSMYSQAIAEAKNKGLKGAERDAFIDEAVANPTDEMLRNATMDAEMAVFQNDTALGRAASAIGRIPGGEIVVPFKRTPAAVAMQIINYSPIGFAKVAAENIGKGRFSQRLFSQGVGRAAVGTAAWWLGGKLFDAGRIELGRSNSETDQKQQQLEGAQPNSIKIGNKWRQVGSLGPVGFALLAGAYFKQGLNDTGSAWNAMVQAAAGMGQSLTQQTFLSGLDSLNQAISDPQTYAANYFKGLIGSIVPTIIGDVARGTDGVERRQQGILDGAKAKIPGLRQTLEPQVDVLGGIRKTPDFLTVMLDPTRPTTASDDPTVLELKRLADAGHRVAPTQLGNKNGYDALTPRENTMLWRRTGEMIKGKLTNLFQDPKYQALSDEEKDKTIAKFVDKTNDISRAEMVLHKTKGVEGAELKKELSKLKDSGLMTKTVYGIYQSLR